MATLNDPKLLEELTAQIDDKIQKSQVGQVCKIEFYVMDRSADVPARAPVPNDIIEKINTHLKHEKNIKWEGVSDLGSQYQGISWVENTVLTFTKAPPNRS